MLGFLNFVIIVKYLKYRINIYYKITGFIIFLITNDVTKMHGIQPIAI